MTRIQKERERERAREVIACDTHTHTHAHTHSEVISIDPGNVVVEPPSLMQRVRHIRAKVQDCIGGEVDE